MNTLLSSNVPDPSDFPPLTISPGLRSLDASVRCTICGELFDAPVTLPCGHCFCSFCVRTALAEKQECPGCRKATNDGHLRPNPAIEEIVAVWKLSRPYLLKLSKEDEHQRQSTPLNTPRAKRRKITANAGNANNVKSAASAGSSTTTRTSPSKPKRSRHSSEDFFDTTIPTSDADEDEMPIHHSTTIDPVPDGLVACPMCNKLVRYNGINQHIDKGCRDLPESTRSTKSDWNKIMMAPSKGKQRGTSDPEDNFPLPKASYGTLKDKKLKEMLLEYDLSVNGDRNMWIQRHQRWVMIYNANLDRSQSNRKSKQELKRELKKWEDDKPKKKKPTVEDSLAHEKRHKTEFAQLIDAARGGKSSSRKRTLLSERSNSDISAPLSSAPQEYASQTKGQVFHNEDAIVIDSEEEREDH